MPTKITVNCTSGKAEEVEMTGAELAAHQMQRANVPVEPPDPLPALLTAIDNVQNLAQAKRLLKAIARRAGLRHLANDPDGALP